MEAHIHSILPEHDMNYDEYEGLFASVIYIGRTLYNKGIDPDFMEEKRLTTNYESTKKLLLEVVELMRNGRSPETINVIMDVEYNQCFFKTGTTAKEINELLLAKVLMERFVARDYDTIYYLITALCSPSVYSKFLPGYAWIEMDKEEESCL